MGRETTFGSPAIALLGDDPCLLFWSLLRVKRTSHCSAHGLIVAPSASAWAHRDLIIAFAAQYRLPAVYAYRVDAAAGGLISYGPDPIDQFRRAAGYVAGRITGAGAD